MSCGVISLSFRVTPGLRCAPCLRAKARRPAAVKPPLGSFSRPLAARLPADFFEDFLPAFFVVFFAARLRAVFFVALFFAVFFLAVFFFEAFDAMRILSTRLG